MRAIPPLPAGVVVQLFFGDTGVTHRLTEDGRYLITMPGRPEETAGARSRYEPGSVEVSPDGMERLRMAARAVGFFGMPSRLPTVRIGSTGSAPVRLPGGATFRPQPMAFTVRDGEQVATVSVKADPRVPSTLGALEPLYRALDNEALGYWLYE
jgi:hypothetical protein